MPNPPAVKASYVGPGVENVIARAAVGRLCEPATVFVFVVVDELLALPVVDEEDTVTTGVVVLVVVVAVVDTVGDMKLTLSN